MKPRPRSKKAKKKDNLRKSVSFAKDSTRKKQSSAISLNSSEQLPMDRRQENPGLGNFFNRELSLLQFNHRVLQLSQDPSLPLLERLNFLSISTTNLDEFFEIRVAGLRQHLAYDIPLSSPDRLHADELLEHISLAAHSLVTKQYQVLNDEILPSLQKEGIAVLRRDQWTTEQSTWIRNYFKKSVLPVLTPVGLDPAHPFPRILNKSLNFIISLKGEDAYGRTSNMAVVQAPRMLPRLIQFPSELTESDQGGKSFALLSSIIHEHVGKLFPGMKIKGCYQFRVTRDSDLWVDEEEVEDVLSVIQGELLSRRFAGAVRLEVSDKMPAELETFLLDQFELTERELYRVNGLVNMHRLSALCKLANRPDLKFPPFVQSTPKELSQGRDLFAAIRSKPIILNHPFQSLSPVLELLQKAASDPNVLAIKLTVYRAGLDSPLVKALEKAAHAGKEVTAVVELLARFDEAANIELATRLQEAGAKVVYGIVGYKAHAKMLLIVRREDDELVRYAHLSTGNYHVETSKSYTDWGYLTTDPKITEDVHNLFQQLTGLGKASALNKLWQSPFRLHANLIEAIEQETANAREGKKAQIIAKMNSIIEKEVINKLYEASQAGVQIDLIIRGTCCLRPGVKGLSENIRVRSVLGQFLEHSRIFYFYADAKEKLYCSSADWMPRNFFRRVESCFPIEAEDLKQRVITDGLMVYLSGGAFCWELQANGEYVQNALPGQEQDSFAQLGPQQRLLQSLLE